MADISKVTLPDGNSYNFKDAELRNRIPDVVGDVTATDPTAVTESVSPYYTKEEVNKLIPDVSGFQTADQVNTLVGNKGYQTATDVNNTLASYATTADVEAKGYQTASQVESAITAKKYQTASDVDSAITAKGYQTASQVETAAKSAINSKITVSNEEPTGGADGDIWFKYEE